MTGLFSLKTDQGCRCIALRAASSMTSSTVLPLGTLSMVSIIPVESCEHIYEFIFFKKLVNGDPEVRRWVVRIEKIGHFLLRNIYELAVIRCADKALLQIPLDPVRVWETDEFNMAHIRLLLTRLFWGHDTRLIFFIN